MSCGIELHGVDTSDKIEISLNVSLLGWKRWKEEFKSDVGWD